MKNNKWQECGETGTIVCGWREYKMVQLPWKTVWWFIKRFKQNYCMASIALMGIYSKELKTEMHTNSCI